MKKLAKLASNLLLRLKFVKVQILSISLTELKSGSSEFASE